VSGYDFLIGRPALVWFVFFVIPKSVSILKIHSQVAFVERQRSVSCVPVGVFRDLASSETDRGEGRHEKYIMM